MRLGLVTAAVAAVLVLVAINTVRARRRGMSVAETLRPHATELNSLQDDLLGRPRTTGNHPDVGRPVATLVDDRHPSGGLTDQPNPDTHGQHGPTGDPTSIPPADPLEPRRGAD